jgi:hypothetical protein
MTVRRRRAYGRDLRTYFTYGRRKRRLADVISNDRIRTLVKSLPQRSGRQGTWSKRAHEVLLSTWMLER